MTRANRSRGLCVVRHPALFLGSFVLCLLVCLQVSMHAQRARTASLQVTVVDATGAALIGATVDLTRAGTAATPRTIFANTRGEARFDNLRPGRYALRVSLNGFSDFRQAALVLKPGANHLNVALQVAVSASVTVAPDAQSAAVNPHGNTMTTTLGQDQIDALPEDDTDLQEALSAIGGADAEMTVDGFVGGSLPPKSEIQQIRISRNVFSADRHNRGGSRIEIVTRPGTQQWRSMLSFGFRDDVLNARNAFAETRPPERQGRGRFFLQGPLVKGRSSISIFGQGISAYNSSTIRAATPNGLLNGLVKQPQQGHNVNVRFEQTLGAADIVRVEYRDRRNNDQSQGVGGFSLAENAYSQLSTNHRIRAGVEGTLGGGTYNNLQLQFGTSDVTSTPALDAPEILIPDTMTAGGATQSGTRSGRSADLQEKLSYTKGHHALSFGGQFQWDNTHSTLVSNGNGTFTFSTLADYEAGRPNAYTQWLGNPSVTVATFTGAWFVQDDITLRKNLSLGLGLRNEWQSHLDGAWHPAPRVSATWSPFASGRTTLRGGYGLFHDWYGESDYEQTLQTDGTRGQEISIANPGYPDPLVGSAAVVLPSGRIVQAPGLEMPTVRQSTIGVERRIGKGIRVSLTYIRRTGDHLLRGRNLNAPGSDGIRPDPAVGNIIEIQSIGRSREQLLQTNVSGRLPWRNAFIALRYNFGHAYDDGDKATSLPADNANPNEWGPASNDVHHKLFMFGVVDIAEWLQAGFNVRVLSAAPYTITTGIDNNGDTVFNDRPAGVGRNSARGSGMFRLDLRLTWRLGVGTADSAQPAHQPAGRGPGRRGGGWANGHRAMVELYVRANNVLNTVNYTGYRGTLTSPFFGQPTAALGARTLEIGTMIRF